MLSPGSEVVGAAESGSRGPGLRELLTAVVAAFATLGLGACGSDEAQTTTETGGLATTTTETSAASELPPPPSGPLDDLVAERIGELELEQHQGAGEVRESGAEDARDLLYLGPAPSYDGASISLALWPAPQRARAYARQFAKVLDEEQGFDRRGGSTPFDGGEGEGLVLRLSDGEGIEAAVWTTGSVFVAVLAGREQVKTVLESAPYGRG